MSLVPVPEALPGPVTDTHTHLDLDRDGTQRPPVADALATAASVNVTRVVQVGVDLPSSRAAVELAGSRREVAAAVAIHPNETPRLDRAGTLAAALAEIDSLAAEPATVAVGETGLDHYRTDSPDWAAQERAFRDHVEIARERGKALVIHDRDAHQDVIRVLETMPTPDRVVFHCFSGDEDMASHCVRRGWFLSFAGTLTFRNAETLRRALAVVPPALALVETDSPFLTPHPHRGLVNSSWAVPYTVRAIADVTGRQLERVCEQLQQATADAFGVWG